MRWNRRKPLFLYFHWFNAVYYSKLSLVFLSKAFKAVVHEECFPLLYKCVHQHLGSDSLFFLTPADRIWQGWLLWVYTVNVTGQLLSQGSLRLSRLSGRPPLFTRICFTFFLPNNRSASREETHPVRARHTHTFQPCRAISWRTSVKHQMSTFILLLINSIISICEKTNMLLLLHYYWIKTITAHIK